LQSPLQLLQEHCTLYDLEFGANTNLPELCDDALPTRVVRRYRRQPVYFEAIRVTCLTHELPGLLKVALERWPLNGILHIIVNPVASILTESAHLRLVDRLSVYGQAHRLPYALIVEGALGVLKTRELQPPGT